MQDFSGQNLRGRNFKGQNLSGANFANADIRGANFSNAILRGANFTGAKAGLQKRWVIWQFILGFLLSAVLNFTAAVINAALTVFLSTPESIRTYTIVPGLTLLIVNAVILWTIARQGYTVKAFSTIVTVVAIAFAFAFAVAFTGAVAGASAVAVAVAVAVAGTVAVAVAAAFAVVVAVSSAVAVVVAVAVSSTVAGAGAAAVAAAVAFAILLLSLYVAWRANKEDEKFALVRSFGVAFGALGGTTFAGADLTGANFTGATLKSTNFADSRQRATVLKQVCWKNTKKLDRARPGTAILANPKVRQLLVTSNGINQDYSDTDLSGANLSDAQLNGANLKRSNLSEAILRGADLQNANLTEVNAIDTDFTGAHFTGACLQAWNIDSTTKLDNIDAQYVYLLEGNQERRPSSGEFQPGEFTKLFQEVLNTVDLIFRNGVDWKAFMQAFDRVRVENEETELTIQSIENKGEGVVVVRVAVPIDTDKSKIHSDFNQAYEVALQALEAKYQAEIQAKEREIVLYREKSSEIIEITKLLANKPINVEVTAVAENQFNSDTYNTDLRGANVGNYANKVQDNARQQANQYNYTAEQRQTLAEAAAEIQQLLTQLSTTNPSTTSTEEMAKAITAIEQNPALKHRLLSALKAGGTEAIKELVKHPAVNILLAAIEGWQSAGE